MIKLIHRLAAMIATACIGTFFLSSLVVELFGSQECIVAVKQLIVWPGLFILVPSIAAAGATGFALSKNRRGPLLQSKQKRMPIIAANGVLVLIPAAIFLNQWAMAGAFDTQFYLLQLVELVAGAMNLFLMALNIRDGRRMSGKRRMRHRTKLS